MKYADGLIQVFSLPLLVVGSWGLIYLAVTAVMGGAR